MVRSRVVPYDDGNAQIMLPQHLDQPSPNGRHRFAAATVEKRNFILFFLSATVLCTLLSSTIWLRSMLRDFKREAAYDVIRKNNSKTEAVTTENVLSRNTEPTPQKLLLNHSSVPNHATSLSNCTEVHCVEGPLMGGLNNQLMGYFGLALIALKSAASSGERPCICLPDIRFGYLIGKGRLLHRPITDNVDLTEETSWDPALPRLYFGSPAVVRNVTHPWNRLWTSYSREHPLRHAFFQEILSHPAQHISLALNELHLPNEYIAIHARVERDMRTTKHNHWGRFQGRNLSNILEITREGFVDQGTKKQWNGRVHKAMQHVFIAVGSDILDEDKKVIENGKPPWGKGAVLRRIIKPSTMDYWSSALLDMIVCMHATVFVGFYGSTFSENIAFQRNDPNSTFKYNSGALEEWHVDFEDPMVVTSNATRFS